MILKISILTILLTLGSFSSVHAQDRVFGDWYGAQNWFESHGVTVDAISTNDYIANVSGGIDQTSGVLGNFDLTASIDTEKAKWWEDGTVFIYILGNYGKDPSSYIGDAQVTSNIEAYNTAKLYEAWYNHTFLEDKLSALVGLYDLNSEFNSLDYAGVLINSSFGIEPDISQVGPSIFSTTSLAARLKYAFDNNTYIMAAIFDGIPGDPNNSRGTRIKLSKDDGLFNAVELGYVTPEDSAHHKIAIGAWYHSALFEDFRGQEHNNNRGSYMIGESTIYEENDAEQGAGIFFQFGQAQSDRNQFAHYVGTGITYTGLIPDRDGDILSIGIGSARNGATYRRENEDSEHSETVFELTYRAILLPCLAIQPDLQYVRNPGTDSTLKDAVVAGVRVEVAL